MGNDASSVELLPKGATPPLARSDRACSVGTYAKQRARIVIEYCGDCDQLITPARSNVPVALQWIAGWWHPLEDDNYYDAIRRRAKEV